MSAKSSIDLGLALLAALSRPGVQHSLEDIAAWCNCSKATIYQIEKKALRKIRRELRQREELQKDLNTFLEQ